MPSQTAEGSVVSDDARIKIRLFRNADNFRVFKSGDCIFREGDAGEEMFVIRNGTVAIQVGDKTVATLEQDEIFGEMALVDHQPRSATAMALTDCELVPIDTRRFLFLIGQTPHFALQIMQMLAARLRQMDSTLQRR
ncbi:MAG TPA: cyclic nucleotide-binding domain-containing protein [Verrucomicrobiae bacterium]|jgi:CRP-like cAMP-binding protein|nr:cyclic nucleotide-binding domain-containing protein [Verrucomicrobiae bacterium]